MYTSSMNDGDQFDATVIIAYSEYFIQISKTLHQYEIVSKLMEYYEIL